MFSKIRDRLGAVKSSLCLPDPKKALKRQIAMHQRELVLAEEARQLATATVDYHTRCVAAHKQQLQKLEAADGH